MKKKVFLEAHNIKNPYFGFGQFNDHLIRGLYNANIDDFKMVLHAKDIAKLKAEFGDYFEYKKYQTLVWFGNSLYRQRNPDLPVPSL